MKKSILTLLSIVLLISCSNNKKEIHASTKVENGDFESKLNFWYGKGFKHTNEISYQGDYSLLLTSTSNKESYVIKNEFANNYILIENEFKEARYENTTLWIICMARLYRW